MKMVSKRAQEHRPSNILITMILMIIGIAIGAYILYIFSGGGFMDIEDHFCRFSNQMRGKSTIPIAGEFRPGEVVPKVPKFCITQYVEIKADDWSKCDSEFKILYKTNPLEALRKCAAQQVAHLTYRCWWMGLEGTTNPASWMCFTGKVILDKPTIQEDADAVKNVMRDIKESVKEKLNCAPGATEAALMDCGNFESRVWPKLEDLLKEKLVLDGLADYYEDRLLYGEKNQKGLRDCVKEDVNAQELVAELAVESEVYAKLSGKINTSKCDEAELKTYIKDYVGKIEDNNKNIKDKTTEVISVLKGALGEDADEVIEQVTVETDKGKEIIDVHRIDAVSESVFSVVSLPPNLGEIKEKHVEELIKTTTILNSEKLYSSVISSNELEFLEGFTITPNNLFEIGYCDPPLPIGAGLVSRFTCGDLEKGFPQRIQVASGGRGAGGVTREGSPYCDLGIFPDSIPGVEEIRNGCRALLG